MRSPTGSGEWYPNGKIFLWRKKVWAFVAWLLDELSMGSGFDAGRRSGVFTADRQVGGYGTG
jgi:hypothetical protein